MKGAYDEPDDVAYQDKPDVNEAYRTHLEFMFREFDDGVAVGSHDPAMISYAAELHEEYGTDYEVQMLMGIREDAQTELAATGSPPTSTCPTVASGSRISIGEPWSARKTWCSRSVRSSDGSLVGF